MKRFITIASVFAIMATPAIAQTRRAPARPAPKAAPAAPKPAPAPSAPPRLYDFKGVALETSLEDFRRMPHPDGTSAKTVCTGEKVGNDRYDQEPVDVMIFDSIEKSLGVVKCVWVTTNSQYMNGLTAGLKLAATNYASNEYSFSFIKDPKDGVMRLYEFEGRSNVAVFEDVVEALTGKWGKPVTVAGTVQNKMGASFDQSTSVWSNPLSSITAQSRFSKIDDMAIIMTDTRLLKVVSDARAAKKAATPNAI
ncbi:MAG: hypothetical protein E7773_10110 [Sphingomonas sp.]|uniref:hypothetical protein n=1 Tax=Sphingomonas sp. TaxID=28214 RepID=UPI0011FE08C4|nr:hypothetical protein [Sphingomonas sp.]THD35691.1 MAG: hypothetical protein E7773_10110 [Sphingomonas sp.]